MTSEVQFLSVKDIDSPFAIIICPSYDNAYKLDVLKKWIQVYANISYFRMFT